MRFCSTDCEAVICYVTIPVSASLPNPCNCEGFAIRDGGNAGPRLIEQSVIPNGTFKDQTATMADGTAFRGHSAAAQREGTMRRH